MTLPLMFPRRRLLAGLALTLAAALPAPATTREAREVRSDLLGGPFDGTIESVAFINDVVGTGVFYQAGYFGQRTLVANVEAGHVWGGHEVFDRTGLDAPPSPALLYHATIDPATAPHLGELDYHATMVGHAMAGTGHVGDGRLSLLGAGMAPLATLWSGAIATRFDRTEAGLGSFEISAESFLAPYQAFFEGSLGAKPDVINSSWGFEDPAGRAPENLILDALAAANPTVAFVRSAGNGGATAIPGVGANGIVVGSLGGAGDASPYLRPSAFTSRAAADFFDPVTGVTHVGVRAAVDIAAPGEELALAYYGGATGTLADLVGEGDSATDKYFDFNQAGTSFSSPVVAGGVALLKDVALGDPFLATRPEALDTRVVKSVIQASARETVGWDNGLQFVGDELVTTRALDLATGAGRLDLEAAAGVYLGGTTDVAGDGGGAIFAAGWDVGSVAARSPNDYFFELAFAGPTRLAVSLNWFVNSLFDAASGRAADGWFSDLNLGVWSVVDGAFHRPVARSETLYGNSEFLRFDLGPGAYGLRVAFDGRRYDFADASPSERYGLAWMAIAAVPEPAAAGALFGLALLLLVMRRRMRGGI